MNLILETLAKVGHCVREHERPFVNLDQAAAGGFLVPLPCWQLPSQCLCQDAALEKLLPLLSAVKDT